MNWQDGTSEVVQTRREPVPTASLAYGPVSGDRWAQGIETAGSRSTGESQRHFSGASVKGSPVPLRRVPQKAIQRRRMYLQSCLDELERAHNNGDDPILKEQLAFSSERPSAGALGVAGR